MDDMVFTDSELDNPDDFPPQFAIRIPFTDHLLLTLFNAMFYDGRSMEVTAALDHAIMTTLPHAPNFATAREY